MPSFQSYTHRTHRRVLFREANEHLARIQLRRTDALISFHSVLVLRSRRCVCSFVWLSFRFPWPLMVFIVVLLFLFFPFVFGTISALSLSILNERDCLLHLSHILYVQPILYNVFRPSLLSYVSSLFLFLDSIRYIIRLTRYSVLFCGGFRIASNAIM